ncbi:MAG: peptide/nickel transport system permease protein [Thermomicrobiales bacterium]|nr:peptide/nickel transport system permease protein [Thermomicrobiales bacterium]
MAQHTATVPTRPLIGERARRRTWRGLSSLHAIVRRKTALIGLLIVALVVVAAILAPQIAPFEPTKMHARDRLQGPSAEYWLGTDESGRDLFSRILYGARISAVAAASATALAMAVGIPIGLICGYRGGFVDDVLMRVLDGFLAIPPVLLALTLLAALGPSQINVIIAVGALGMPLTARITRASVLVERERDYTLAARAIGATDGHIMWRILLPNSLPPLIVTASLLAANAILLEAALSFLGLGVQPPRASWGVLLQLGYGYMSHSVWYVTFPGICIFLLVWSLNVLGDALRDGLDPRLRGL